MKKFQIHDKIIKKLPLYKLTSEHIFLLTIFALLLLFLYFK